MIFSENAVNTSHALFLVNFKQNTFRIMTDIAIVTVTAHSAKSDEGVWHGYVYANSKRQNRSQRVV